MTVLPSGAKVLIGKGVNHGLPDYSNSPNAIYIKYNHNETHVTIRFYGADNKLYFEIVYHPEPNIDPTYKCVWHYHQYDEASNTTMQKRSLKTS